MKRSSTQLSTTSNVSQASTAGKKARKGREQLAVVNRSRGSLGLGFPKSLNLVHRYCENVTFNTGAGTGIGFYTFSCNGLYDPNITGSGHQPLYFDQMSALYDHYVVVGSRIRLRVVPDSTSSAKGIRLGCFINDNTGVPTTTVFDTLQEQSLAKTICSAPNNNRPLELTHTWSAKKYFSGSILANTELQGTPSSNPTEQSYYQIFMVATDGVSALNTFLEVQIEYITVWKELVDLSSS